MKNRSILKYEKKYLDEGYSFVIGVDEAGRGPLAGPVVASAVCYRANSEPSPVAKTRYPLPKGEEEKKKFSLIRDSKKLSEKQREELYDFICEHFYVGIGICDHKTIDRINILEATYLAMKKSLTDLFSKINKDTRYKHQKKSKFQMTNFKSNPNDKFQNLKNVILIDGNRIIPNLNMKQMAIIGGDNLVKSISAASIIAKVTRDRMMGKAHEKYPQYNFCQHKGYGTKTHMEMIKKHGACEIHRKSFRPFR